MGRITGKGLADELRDRWYLVIDGVDGRAHYLALPPGTALADYPSLGIVEARPIPESAADQNIARLAQGGIYLTADHLAELEAVESRGTRKGQSRDSSPEQVVRSHVLRLEGLQRAEIVERIEEGVWKVPDDLLARGLLRTLCERELPATGQAIQAETGLVYRPMGEDGQASGVYRRSVMVASGRYVMLDDGLGFSLVPWRPIIEQRLGQSVSATIQAGRVTWEFGRQRGLAT